MPARRRKRKIEKGGWNLTASDKEGVVEVTQLADDGSATKVKSLRWGKPIRLGRRDRLRTATVKLDFETRIRLLLLARFTKRSRHALMREAIARYSREANIQKYLRRWMKKEGE